MPATPNPPIRLATREKTRYFPYSLCKLFGGLAVSGGEIIGNEILASLRHGLHTFGQGAAIAGTGILALKAETYRICVKFEAAEIGQLPASHSGDDYIM